LVSLHPLLSLHVHCYPDCTAELRPQYKSMAADRQTWSRQWELFHCSLVYTVV